MSYSILNFVTKYRGVFVTIFVLPVSFCFKIAINIRNKISFWINRAPKKHTLRVTQIQEQVAQWEEKTDKKVPMCTARPTWQTMSLKHGRYKKKFYNVNVDLGDVLKVDTRKQTVIAQPMVNMGQLSATLIPLGWTLAVLPELDSLTIGGLVSGFGIESSSHKYGLIQNICESFEIVTVEGKYIYCDRRKNPDLFYSIPWSHGALGFLVSVELKIIPAKKYVRLEYIPCYSKKKFIETFEWASRQSLKKADDFVEGLMFSKNSGVVMLGNLADKPVETVRKKEPINVIGRFWKPWFYEHVRHFLTQKISGVEHIPIRDYYHRHTRSLFWEMKAIVPFGNHPLFRYFLGWMAPPPISLLKLTEPKKIAELYDKHHTDQDYLLPMNKLSDMLQLLNKEINFYPLWICPMLLPKTGRYKGMVHSSGKETMFVDVGIYGEPTALGYEAEKTHRKLEAYLRKIGAYQALYAVTYQTKSEFRKMFDHSLLDKMRKKYKCELAFPEPYDKVSRQARS